MVRPSILDHNNKFDIKFFFLSRFNIGKVVSLTFFLVVCIVSFHDSGCAYPLSIDIPMHNASETCPHLIFSLKLYRSHVLVCRLQSHGGCFYNIYRYCSLSTMNMMTTTTLSALDKATQRVR